jgi:hypothetical protein
MFLGTPRGWWIASGILFIGGIALIGSGYGGGLGTVGGVLCLFLGMGIFAAAPMRGRGSAARQEQVAAATAPATPPPTPRRAKVEAGDAADV